MTAPAHPVLMRALGRVVRGLSALFWGLPLALVVCVQTAKADWLGSLGILPPLLATGLVIYGLNLLGSFQRQERIWHQALDRVRIFAVMNFGLSPFLYWWNRIPENPFYHSMVHLMMVTGLLFLYFMNPMLWRLVAMLPDETLRHDTRLFTRINEYLMLLAIGLYAAYGVITRTRLLPFDVVDRLTLEGDQALWLLLLLILVPLALTMALIWKTKEVILASLFEAGA